MKTKRKIIVSLLSIVVVMFLLPLLCSTVMNSRSASGLVFLMFFCINPVFLIDIGITAGTELKKLWFLPVLTAFLFPFLFWLAIRGVVIDIWIYSAIYLVVGLLAMLITSVIAEKKQGSESRKTKKSYILIITTVLITVILIVLYYVGLPFGISANDFDQINLKEIFLDAKQLDIETEDGNYTVKADVEDVTQLLQEVKISKNPISRNRSEDRDATNKITVDGGSILCFNKGYTTLFIDNGVKPTLSYRVLSPSAVKQAISLAGARSFSNKAENKMQLKFKESGSKVRGLSIELKKYELNSQEPYLDVEWKNASPTNEHTYGKSFRIFYKKDGKWKSCAQKTMYFNAIAMLLPANTSATETYQLSGFDLSREGRYRFETGYEDSELWIEFEVYK